MELEPESLHLLALVVTAVFIMFADHDGLNYLRGRVATLPATRVRFLHRAVGWGLAAMIATGAQLLLAEPDVLEEPAFYVKLLLVVALVWNGFWIGRVASVASHTPFVALEPTKKRQLFISGLISGMGWAGAALIGFFFL